jgi:hypothetical protein
LSPFAGGWLVATLPAPPQAAAAAKIATMTMSFFI